MRILILGGCGYVGSALYRHLVAAKHDVVTVDTEERGNPINPANRRTRYQTKEAAFLEQYEAIICVAGRSSVAAAIKNPSLAVDDNLSGLVQMVGQMTGTRPRFLFASSASVLSPATNGHNNIYDATKRASEAIVPLIYDNTYVLRFGTVCGASPNLRLDLVINSMVRSALVDGIVRCANPDASRPILGIRDLCAAVERLVVGPDEPGIYNLASFNTTIGKLAKAVGYHLSVPIEILPSTSGYDFLMKPSRIDGWTPSETVETIIDSLVAQHKQTPLGQAA